MKRILTLLLVCVLLYNTTGLSIAAPVILATATANAQKIEYKKNAPTISYAFVFDGPSSKNATILKQFEKTIAQTTAPDYKTKFTQENIFVGDWSEHGAKIASDKALNSQYTFFKELVWVQRAICAVDWTKASPEAKQFIQDVKENLEKRSDVEFL